MVELTHPKISLTDEATALACLDTLTSEALAFDNQALESWGRTNPAVETAVDLVSDELCESYGPAFGSGCHRMVWFAGHVVYKLPLCLRGVKANRHEFAAYINPKLYKGIPVAACDLVWHQTGLPIIIMETVIPTVESEIELLPDWAIHVDGQQIGKNCNGKWVVFDAGMELASWPQQWRGAEMPPIAV